MRVALMCGPDTEALKAFVDGIAEKSVALEWLRFPDHDPYIVVAYQPGRNPPVQFATTPDGSFAIVDGEVFDLPANNEGRGNDAAAALLSLYQSQGVACVDKIDASACCVIWDAPAARLHIVRDRYGLVPSYYHQQPRALVWASDIASVLPFVDDTSPNLAAMDFLLKDGFIPAPWTFARAVSKLPPAHRMTVGGDGQAKVERYWLPVAEPVETMALGEVLDELGSLLTQALARRSSAQAKLGVMLSGGVDSKLLAATMTQKLGQEIESFTFRYEDYDGVYNENNEAERAAEFLGTNHHQVSFGPHQIADNFTRLICGFGEPFTSGLHTAMLQDVAADGVTQLFNGAGADGWYLGNRNHHGMRAMAVPGPLRQLARLGLPFLKLIHGPKASALKSVLDWSPTAFQDHFHLGITDLPFRRRLYTDPSWIDGAHRERNALFAEAAKDYDSFTLRNKLILLHAQFYLADHVFYWNHCWSRAHDLAARSPYFDATLMDFVWRLPKQNQNKMELRELAATMIPRDMAYTKKFPQSLPIGPWFRGPLKDFIQDKLSVARVNDSGLFDNKVLQPLIADHIGGGQGFGMALWAILTIIEWQELVAKGALVSSGEEDPSRRPVSLSLSR